MIPETDYYISDFEFEDWLRVMIPVRWSELIQSIKPFGETNMKELLREAGAAAGFSAAQLERDGVSVARVGGLRDFGEGEVFELPHSGARLSVIFDTHKKDGVEETLASLGSVLDLALLVDLDGDLLVGGLVDGHSHRRVRPFTDDLSHQVVALELLGQVLLLSLLLRGALVRAQHRLHLLFVQLVFLCHVLRGQSGQQPVPLVLHLQELYCVRVVAVLAIPRLL